MATLPGARSGGATHHIQGPHLIPNVGREAMLVAEVVRRKPKFKGKPEKPAPKPVPKTMGKKEKKNKKRNNSSPSRPLEHSRSRSRPTHRDLETSNASFSPSLDEEHVQPHFPESATAERREVGPRYPSESLQRERTRSLDNSPPPREELSASAQEREARRIEEERRQLQLLKEAQEKRRKIDSERKKNLGGVFALSADDFEKEDKEEQSKAKVEKERLPLTTPRSTERRPRDPKVLLDESTPGSGFEKCWKNWDFTKSADDPGEVARQFMRVTAAKRRGYAPREQREQRSPSRRRR